jgi:hypothetical protein
MPSFAILSEHDIAALFRWANAKFFNAQDACALRSTCRLAVRGYDCAVHAGWVPIAGHRSGEPAEEGATCEWVSGWFPMRLRRSCANAAAPPPPVTLRVEHRLMAHQSLVAAVGFPPLPVIVCETLRRRQSAKDSQTATPTTIFESPVLGLRGLTRARIDAPATDTVISADFFSSSTLTALDASRLTSVTTIQPFFLWSAQSLTSVDLSGFAGVTSIGRGFCSCCTSLRAIDVTGLVNVVSIETGFLSGGGIERFDASDALGSLTSLGNTFLAYSPALTGIDVSGLSALTSIGTAFANGCRRLTTFDTTGLTSVTALGDDALAECTSLTEVDTSGLTALRTIGSDFCRGVPVETLDASALASLMSVGDRFLFQAEYLVAFDTTGMASLTSIGNFFLAEARQLKTFNAAGLAAVTSIGSDWLAGCTALTEIKGSEQGFASLVSVGSNCMSGCTAVCPFALGNVKLLGAQPAPRC